MLFKLRILSYLVSIWDTFLCLTSVLDYSVFSSPFPSLLLSPIAKLKFCVIASPLFHTLGWPMCPETQAKPNRFVTALMTAAGMLSKFLNSPKLLFCQNMWSCSIQHFTGISISKWRISPLEKIIWYQLQTCF